MTRCHSGAERVDQKHVNDIGPMVGTWPLSHAGLMVIQSAGPTARDAGPGYGGGFEDTVVNSHRP